MKNACKSLEIRNSINCFWPLPVFLFPESSTSFSCSNFWVCRNRLTEKIMPILKPLLTTKLKVGFGHSCRDCWCDQKGIKKGVLDFHCEIFSSGRGVCGWGWGAYGLGRAPFDMRSCRIFNNWIHHSFKSWSL